MMDDCSKFCCLFNEWTDTELEGKEEASLSESEPKSQREFDEELKSLESSFATLTKNLVASLNYFAANDYEHHMANLVCRLDYNFFFSGTSTIQ